ncbi:MAG: hypothetical protein IPK80_06480 [Nannocystis sp.]|nr:hypothetical protein [Nannocystis sp.]
MNTAPSTRRAPLLAACAALSTACALQQPSARLTDARLGFAPVLAARTSFESEAAERGAPPADEAPRAARGPTELVFWTGVILAAVGGGAALALGTTARVTEGKVISGFEGDGLSRARLDELNDRGAGLNNATIAVGALGLVGAIMATTAYGVDYTRCGKLAPKRRRCDAAR